MVTLLSNLQQVRSVKNWSNVGVGLVMPEQDSVRALPFTRTGKKTTLAEKIRLLNLQSKKKGTAREVQKKSTAREAGAQRKRVHEMQGYADVDGRKADCATETYQNARGMR